MYQYFSKAEDQSSQAIKQAAKKFSEIKMHHNDTMKRITKAYLHNQEFPNYRDATPVCNSGRNKIF